MTKLLNSIKPISEFVDYFADEQGNIYSFKPRNQYMEKPSMPRKLKPGKNKKGYLNVSLYKNGIRYYRLIHRLVLETFVGPCPKGMEGCHNNGVPWDNRVKNLRYDTPENNNLDKIKHNTNKGPIGEKQGRSKLNELQVRIIRKYPKHKGYISDLSNMFGVCYQHIYDIINNKTWKHI